MITISSVYQIKVVVSPIKNPTSSKKMPTVVEGTLKHEFACIVASQVNFSEPNADPIYPYKMKYYQKRNSCIIQNGRSSSSSISFKLCISVYDPCWPLPTGIKEARNHVISKGPCQPKDVNFPADKRNRRF
jgi:hypothetical protein